jgi:hypothetical protein
MRSTTTTTSRSINGSSSGNYITIDDYNLLEQPQTVIDNTLLAKFPIKDVDIYNYTITNNKLSINSIGTNNIIDNSITTAKLNNLSVTNSKISDLD